MEYLEYWNHYSPHPELGCNMVTPYPHDIDVPIREIPPRRTSLWVSFGQHRHMEEDEIIHPFMRAFMRADKSAF